MCLRDSLLHIAYYSNTQSPPTEDNLWYLRPLFLLAVLVPAAAGWVTARFAGGLARSRRILAATLCGAAVGLLYSLTTFGPVSYTHLRAHETTAQLVCRLLLEKKKTDFLIRRLSLYLADTITLLNTTIFHIPC